MSLFPAKGLATIVLAPSQAGRGSMKSTAVENPTALLWGIITWQEKRVSSSTKGGTYSAALDGLRGVCLVGVLLFHAPIALIQGGFLGVSTFFTLSGYLITGLLLAEWEGSGSINFLDFWRRRLRRLLPALWIAAVCILATSIWWIPEANRTRLTWDTISSLLFASNWRFMDPEYAYTRIFSDPSAPAAHLVAVH